jgi:MFS family permease
MPESVSLPKRTPKNLMIVIVIALGSFMAGLDGTIVNIALLPIAKSFDVSTVMVSCVLNAYLIIMVSLLLAASRIGDMKGYRNIFLAGFAISALALYLLFAISSGTNIGHIALYLFLPGAGTGIAYSPLNSAVMGEAPAKDRGSTPGLMRVMTNCGSTLSVSVVMLVATMAAGQKIAGSYGKQNPLHGTGRRI